MELALTPLQSSAIKVMQDDGNFDESGISKHKKGMQQCHFLHLLNDRDNESPLLVEALIGLEAMGLVTIRLKIPSKGRDETYGRILTVGDIFLTPFGRSFDTDGQGI